MLQSKFISIGLIVVAGIGLSSCAYVTHSKGMVITDSSLKGKKPTWISHVELSDPPVIIRVKPGAIDNSLSVGPCILLPLAVLPNPIGIYSALRRRKDWKIPNEKIRVQLDFWRAGWHHNIQKFGADAVYKLRPQEFRLKAGEKVLSPVSVSAKCDSSETGFRDIDCPAPVDGTYAFQVSVSTSIHEPEYEVTFDVSASTIERATLHLDGISRNDKQLQLPPLEIARRRFFTVGCVLGEGSESYYFTQ